MQRVFLIHGWTGNPNGDWFLWARRELQKLNYEVIAPQMPDTNRPKIRSWVAKIEEVVKDIKPDDIFVSHSIGCQAVERYLQTLPEDTKIAKVILIAPWVTLTEQTFKDVGEDRSVAEPWLTEPIDYGKIKVMAREWVAVFSDNDPYVDYEENYKVYKDKLGAKIILKHGLGHISAEQGVTKIPFLLELVK